MLAGRFEGGASADATKPTRLHTGFQQAVLPEAGNLPILCPLQELVHPMQGQDEEQERETGENVGQHGRGRPSGDGEASMRGLRVPVCLSSVGAGA